MGKAERTGSIPKCSRQGGTGPNDIEIHKESNHFRPRRCRGYFFYIQKGKVKIVVISEREGSGRGSSGASKVS